MNNVEINFSIQGNGACPFCVHEGDCHIVERMKEFLSEEVKPIHDDEMEVVIYSCPEFEEEM
jgi:hypothetical protein